MCFSKTFKASKVPVQVVTTKVKLLECVDVTFTTEFENKEGLKGDFKDLLNEKIHLDALNQLNSIRH